MPIRLGPADRKALLLGTALASTLLLGSLIAPSPAAAQVNCLTVGPPPPGGPIIVTNPNDSIVCVNVTDRNDNANGAVIDLETDGDNEFIDLFNSGTLTANDAGDAYGILTETGGENSRINIENTGNVTATSTGGRAFGILADTYGDESRVTITNSGNVTASGGGYSGYGIRTYTSGVDSHIAVDNSGALTVSSDYLAVGIQAETYGPGARIDITNRGDIEVTGFLAAFGVHATTDCCDASVSINNSGDIAVSSSLFAGLTAGIYARTSGSNIAISNSGAITATGASYGEAFGIEALSLYGDIAILNKGPIKASTDGVYVSAYFGDVAVVNEAKIEAGAHGIHVGAGIPFPAFGDVAIANSGAIKAGEIGILAITGSYFSPANNGGDIAIINQGPISAPSGIVATTADNGSGITIVNDGKITAKVVGIYAASGVEAYVPCGCGYASVEFMPSGAGDNSPIVITNSGVIDPAIGIKAVALGNNSPITINNSGTILGSFAAIYTVGYSGTKIVNTGDISAGSNLAISVYGSGAEILNAGLITGFLDLSYQRDVFVNQAGGVFEAKRTSYFNSGNDLFVNQAGGTVQAATDRTVSETSAFEGLETFRNSGLISLVDNKPGDSFTISNTPGGTDLDFVAGPGSTLAVDAFLGGPGNSSSDTFTIEGDVSGVTTVQVVNTNYGPGVFNPSGIRVVTVTGATPNPNAFQLAQTIDTGFFDYDLFFTPTGSGFWELRSFPGGGAFLLPQLVTAAQDIWHQSSSTWFDRTADLRVLMAGGPAPTAYDPGRKSLGASGPYPLTPAVWARGSGSWLDRDDTQRTTAYGRDYSFDLDRELQTLDFQVGVDMGKRDVWDQGDALVFGLLGGFVHGDLDYDALARSFNFDGGQVGAYATYLNGGLFVDTLLNVHLYSLETSTLGFPNSLDANTVGLRTDTGYRFGSFNGGPFIEPLATLEVTWADIEGFSLGGNTVSFDDDANVRGRLGLRAGTTMAAWEGTLMEPFVTGSLWGNLTDDNSATLVSTGRTFRFEDQLDDVWGEVSAGVNLFNFSQTTAVFAKLDVTFGDDLTGVGGKAGMRVNW